MRLSRVETATFRLLVQCLNQLCHRVSPPFLYCKVNYKIFLAGYIPAVRAILIVEFIKSRFGIGHFSLGMPRLPIANK
jgi:hypothetical protein